MAIMSLGAKGEAFHLEGQTWICKNELPSDIIINIGEISFHLHKFPLLSRSGLLQSMISEFHSGNTKDFILHLHDLPGGPKAFELVAKFCYDVKFDLNPLNVVSVRCASEHLRMTENYIENNLIQQTENFLTEIFEHNWNDTLRVMETCESLLPLSEDLEIVQRCINSLAQKACTDPTIFGWPFASTTISAESTSTSSRVMWNGINTIGEKPRSPKADWWYEDISLLSLPLYKRLILAIKSKGMTPETIVGSIKNYAVKHLTILSTMQSSSISAQSESEQRVVIHELVELLPFEKEANSTRFLVCLLRAAMILHASPSCWENLERRVGAQLDEATLEDILIPNLGYTVETIYDIDCVQRIVESFMSVNDSGRSVLSSGIVDEGQYLMDTPSSLTRITMVAKLVDGFLGEIASDVNLKFPKFQALAAAIPSYARPSDDGIYRAIDIYLKSHPWLPDSDREQLCQLMNCQKLSLEACTHAAQNERLPLRVIVQVLFFEQLRLRTTMAGWFFVSDDMNNAARSQHGNLMLPKSTNPEIIQNQKGSICDESDEKMGMDDEQVRMKILLLERECYTLKRELGKLERGKGFWERLCNKIGARSRHHHNDKQGLLEC